MTFSIVWTFRGNLFLKIRELSPSHQLLRLSLRLWSKNYEVPNYNQYSDIQGQHWTEHGWQKWRLTLHDRKLTNQSPSLLEEALLRRYGHPKGIPNPNYLSGFTRRSLWLLHTPQGQIFLLVWLFVLYHNSDPKPHHPLWCPHLVWAKYVCPQNPYI